MIDMSELNEMLSKDNKILQGDSNEWHSDESLKIVSELANTYKPVFQNIYDSSDDPKGEQFKVDTARLLSTYGRMPFERAYDFMTVSSGTLFDRDLDPKGAGESFYNALKEAHYTSLKGKAMSKWEMFGDEKYLKQADEYNELALKNHVHEDFNWLTDLFIKGAQPAYSMGKFVLNDLIIKGSAFAVSNILGGGIPFAVVAGSKAANMLSKGYNLYDSGTVQAGNTYYDLSKLEDANGNKLDLRSPFGKVAYGTMAFVQGFIEVGSMEFMPGYKKLQQAIGPNTVSNALTKGLKDKLIEFGADYFKSMGSESLEEGMQSIVEDLTSNILKAHDNKIKDAGFETAEAKEIMSKSLTSMVEAAKSMVLFGAFTGGVGNGAIAARAKVDANKSFKTLKSKENDNSTKTVDSRYVINDSHYADETFEQDVQAKLKNIGKEKLDIPTGVPVGASIRPKTREDSVLIEAGLRNGSKFLKMNVGEFEPATNDVQQSMLNSYAYRFGGQVNKESNTINIPNKALYTSSINRLVRDSYDSTQNDDNSYTFKLRDDSGKAFTINIKNDETAANEFVEPDSSNASGLSMPSFMNPMMNSKPDLTVSPEVQNSLKTKYSNILSKKEISNVAGLYNVLSKGTGKTVSELDNIIEFRFETTEEINEVAKQSLLGQGLSEEEAIAQLNSKIYRGYHSIQDGKQVITLTPNKNATTIFHEMGHVFSNLLSPGQKEIFTKAYNGVSGAMWASDIKKENNQFKLGDSLYESYDKAFKKIVPNEEKFADDFVAYVSTGVAASEELKSIFDKFKEFLTEFISTFKSRLSDSTIKAFNEILNGNIVNIEKKSNRFESINTLLQSDELEKTKSKYNLPNNYIVDKNNTKKYLAPNGKISNLSEELYFKVRTPSFKKWFGDWENNPEYSSKVIDENGEPLVVYHGTDNLFFDVFDKEKIGTANDSGFYGSGFYFAENHNEAEWYGDNILELFLNIKIPFIHQIMFSSKFNDLNEYNNMKYFYNISEILGDDSFVLALTEFGDEISALDFKKKIDQLSVNNNNPFEAYIEKYLDGDDYIEDQDNLDIFYYSEEFATQLIKNGYDGVFSDDINKGNQSELLAFGSKQIKSIYNNGEFNKENDSILYQSDDKKTDVINNKGTLYVSHNISEKKLIAQYEIGGMPMPSLAITKPEINNDGYGEISLIGNNKLGYQLINQNEVWNKDIWSPTVPLPSYHVNKIGLKNAIETLNENLNIPINSHKVIRYLDNNGNTQNDINDIVNAISNSHSDYGFDEAFFKSKNIPLRIPYKSFKTDLKSTNIINKSLAILTEEVFSKQIEDYTFLDLERLLPIELYKEKWEKISKVFKRWANDLEGFAQQQRELVAQQLPNYIEKYRYSKQIDEEVLQKRIKNKFNKKLMIEYKSWLHELIKPFWSDKFIETPKGNNLPFTAEGIYSYMQDQTLKGNSEGSITYNFNLARSLSARKMRSREDLAKYEKKLENSDNNNVLSEALKESYMNFAFKNAINVNSYSILDDSSHALADYLNKVDKPSKLQMKRQLIKYGFNTESKDFVDIALEFAENLRNQTRKYFEAKPNSILNVSDFIGAVVPNTLSSETISKLKQDGLDIVKYKPGKNSNRQKVTQKYIEENNSNILFQSEDKQTEVINNKGTLVALHNISESNLVKAYNLGGMPMPSIAITKPELGHNHFGEITFIGDKVLGLDLIDSQSTFNGNIQSGFFPDLENKDINEVFEIMINNLYVYKDQYSHTPGADYTSYTELIRDREHAKTFEKLLIDKTGGGYISAENFRKFNDKYIDMLSNGETQNNISSVTHKWLKLGKTLEESYYEVIGKEISNEIYNDFLELFKYASQFERAYFEAKPRKIYKPSDFYAAIVPETTSTKLVETLREDGLQVEFYKNNRNEVINNVVQSNGNSILFESDNILDTIDKDFKENQKTFNKFKKDINSYDETKKGKRNEYFTVLKVMPLIFRELGYASKPLILYASKIHLILSNKKINGKNTHGDSLNKNLLIKALYNISDPEAIYHSVDENGQPREHEYVVVVGVKDKHNYEIMVALHLNRFNSGYEINQIASIYGRNNIHNYIKNKVGKYQVYSKFGQKNTREAPAGDMQYVRVVSSSSTIYNIITRDDIVKKYNLDTNQKLWQSEPKEKDSIFNNFEVSDIEEALNRNFYVPSSALYPLIDKSEVVRKEIELRKDLAAFPWILDTARSCDTLDEFLQSINEITDEENLDENLAFDLDNFKDTWLSNKDSKRAFAAKIYEFSRVVTPQQADRVFINSTSDKYDLINLAIELNTPYMDVENNKVVIKQPVFKGVSPIVLSINEDSTKKQVSQALNQIKKNTKAYRQALIVKQQAEQRIKMLHGDNDISDISDRLAYSEMFLNDVDIEEELSTYSGFKNIKVDENIKQKNLTNIELTEEYIEKQIQELDIKDKELSAAKKEVNSLEKEVEKLKASKVDNKETKKELTSVNNALKRALKTIEVLNEKEVNRKARIVRNDLIKNIKTRSKFNSDIHDAKYKESIDWVHHIFDRENREDTSLNIPFSDDFNRPGNEPLYIPRMLMEYIPKDFILTRDNRVSRWNVEDLEKLELVLRNLLDDSKASLFNKKEIERQRREAINNAYFTQMYGRQAERFDENLGYASAINRDIRVNVENAPENIFFHGKEGKMKRAYNVFTGAFGHIQRISRELDGNKEGVLYNHFTRDLQGNFSSYYLHKQQRIEVLDKYMQDHDININYMAEKIYKYNPSKNIEIDLTREQCLGVYIYSLNKFGLPKLMSAGGNKLSNNDILNIQAKLSNKDIMFAHKLIELIGRGDASERLENTLYHVYNKIIKKEKNYFPLAADSIEPKEDKSSKTKVIGAKRTLQSWVDNGMMKDRVDAIYSLDLNVISTFKSQVDAQERVIAFSRWVKDSNYLLADNASVGQILSNLYGESRQKNLQDFVNRVAKISEQISKIEKMANLALSNFSASRITYSVSATMHQLASLGASVRGDIDTDILVACLIDPHVMNRKSEMETLAPEMKNRVFNLEVSRFRNLEHTNKTTRGVSKAVDAGMKGSELIDAFVTTKLWWGVYKTQIRKGQTEQEAIFRASQFIAETQSSSNEMDLSDVQAGKSHFLRTLARFKNDNFQRWNQLFFDLPYFMKTKQYSKVMGTLFSNVLSAGIFVATTGALMKAAGDDEDKYKSLVKSFIDSVIRQLIGDTIPLVGDDVVEAFDTYRFGSSMAWQPALNAVGTVWQEFKDEDDDTEALKKKGFNMFSETLGLLYGLPTTQSQRAYRAIKEKDLLRLLGGYWSQ